MPPAMARFNPSGGSVLIIDNDKSVRQMIAALLKRAGFTTEFQSADRDGSSAPLDRRFDVVIRDVNLAPRCRESAIRELEQTPPELLLRTVITTTFPAALRKHTTRVRPFAILPKPFDIDLLVETVRQCRDRSPRPRSDRKQPNATREEADRANDDFAQIRKFVADVPRLRDLLSAEHASPQELLLRNEMRRTALELAHVLNQAAQFERNRGHAAVLLGAALIGAQLAGRSPAAPQRGAGRDH